MASSTDLNLKIEGMHCASCVSSIENGVGAVPGVETCRVNLAMNSAVVSFDSSKTSEQQIIQNIEKLGFKAEPGKPDVLTANAKELAEAKRKFLVALSLTVPLMIVAMLPMFTCSNA